MKKGNVRESRRISNETRGVEVDDEDLFNLFSVHLHRELVLWREKMSHESHKLHGLCRCAVNF